MPLPNPYWTPNDQTGARDLKKDTCSREPEQFTPESLHIHSGELSPRCVPPSCFLIACTVCSTAWVFPNPEHPAHASVDPNLESHQMSMPITLAVAASAALSLSAVAASQPAHVHSIERSTTVTALTNVSTLSAVRIGDLVEMPVTLQDGTHIELELERFNPFTNGAQIISVDAQGNERALDLSADIHLRGHLAGDESQIAYIAITPFGTSGYIEHDGQPHVVSTGAYSGQAKVAEDLFVFPSDMLNLAPLGQNCAVDVNNPRFNPLGIQMSPERESHDSTANQGSPPARNATIALETDYEFSNVLFGGNTTASASYATSLFAAISTIYDRDVNMTVSLSYLRTYESNNDPYGGSDIGDFLDQVQDEFNTGAEANIERSNVHGLSARNLGGGVAYFPSTCSDFWSIGVSANLDGFFPNPLQDNSHNNWDIMVTAHELGHNFGSGHTHDSYTPVIDGCGNGDCSQALDSTIMSYCHLCSGGLSNIDLRFHPRVQTAILEYLSSLDCDLSAESEPCPGDVNGDGDVNFFDISHYLSLFNGEFAEADLNEDGNFDFFDISAFITLYNQGCP